MTAVQNRQWYQRFKQDEFKNTQNNARYRDVSFIIDSAQFLGGRRTVEHEYPQRDIPYSEDLGRALRKFDITGILLGDDYLEQRDNLVNACELGGPGELVHPYYGTFTVVCKSFEISDTRRETRMCKFVLILVETGELLFPIVSIDTTAAIETQVNLSFDNNKTWFESAYGIIKKQIIFAQGKRETLTSMLDNVNKAKRLANMPAEYYQQLELAEAQTNALILSPSDLFDTIKDLTAFGILEVLEGVDFIKSFLGLQNNSMDFETDTNIPSDDTGYMEEMTQVVSLITMCLLVSKIDFVSTEDALFYRGTTLDKIDALLLTVTDNQTIQDLKDLRKVVFEDIEDRSLTLPSIVEHIENLSIPAIVLSYKLYGNVDQEQDIIDRNKVQNPNFVPGGVNLEVLTDAG